MNPQHAYAIARAQQQELRRHAEGARLAAELPTSRRLPQLHVTLPHIEFGRRVAGVRARVAHS